MDISWHGSSAVLLSDGRVSLAVDPDLAQSPIPNHEKIDFAVSSRDDHGIHSDTKKIFDWPGEFEVKGVSFVALEADGCGLSLSYRFRFDGIHIAVITGLVDYPPDDFVELLGDVHVLLVNIGKTEKKGLTVKEVYKLVEAIEPAVVIPIGWKDGSGEFSDFLKEVDVPMPEAQRKYSFKKGSLNMENMELVVLEVK